MKSEHSISKSNLAKLLATENLAVEYRKIDTAAFDIVNRRLILPVWNDMTPEMTDLLIGHEIGHALDTPQEYITAQEGKKGFKSFLNVVEDARIERKVKDRYPGLRRSFSLGYKEFIKRDFFQLKGKDANKMLLIDRINLHFKIGPFYNVNFTAEEQVFVDAVERTETFQDVVDVATKIYDYCKQELEDKREQAQQEFQERVDSGEFDDYEFEEGDSDGNGEFEYRDPSEIDGTEEFGENEDGQPESDFTEKGNDFSNTAPEYRDPIELQDYDEVKSVTDEDFQESLRGTTEKKTINNGKMPTNIDTKNLIVKYSDINLFDSQFYVEEDEAMRYKPNMLLEFESRNKNAIGYLVKEFEMKKKASELARITVASTGVLDTNKLHTYKFNDDIFRKVGVLPQGKNHGIVMFLDWSGSMQDNMSGTIEQLITMTTFCRKVNIPFEVYAFTSEYDKYKKKPEIFGKKTGELQVEGNFNLLNLLSSTMRTPQYRKMANDLLNYGDCFQNNGRHYYSRKYLYINDGFGLGGTPLNATIIVASKIVNEFRKQTRSEVVDVIFLTDGDDSSSMWTYSPDSYGRGSVRIGQSDRNQISYLDDAETAKSYRVNEQGITPTLLRILKDRTKCNLIGFYVLSNGVRSFRYAADRFKILNVDTSYKTFKTQKHFAIDGYGYDKYFLIPGGDELSTEDDSLDDLLGKNNTEFTARKLKSAFLSMNKSRLTNRVLLSKVIEEIA